MQIGVTKLVPGEPWFPPRLSVSFGLPRYIPFWEMVWRRKDGRWWFFWCGLSIFYRPEGKGVNLFTVQ